MEQCVINQRVAVMLIVGLMHLVGPVPFVV